MADYSSLIEGFTLKSKQVEERLQAAIAVLSEGRAPSENDSQLLTIAMGELRESYAEVRSAAQTIKPEVPDGQSVSVYEEVFREHATKALEKQIELITGVLERFLCVSSDSAEYAEALEPYQREVEKTLAELRSSEIAIDEKLKTEYRNQDALLCAIAIEDLDTP